MLLKTSQVIQSSGLGGSVCLGILVLGYIMQTLHAVMYVERPRNIFRKNI